MSLRIYNTLTRSVQDFQPLESGHVRMYVCGMTVYDLCHLGHARSMVAFDVVQRWLRASGLRVTYVRNITDIDDKIIQRATQNGETIRNLTDRMIAALHEDADALGIERPTHEPRATEYVPQMLNLISTLQQKGLAYSTPSGDVNYAVRKFAGYGQLSGKSIDELNAGERVAVQDDKRDPLDFVLWKAAKKDEPADVKWESEFGTGRPGWHIECSAMGCALLGEQFDIHGGGADLQFPHHENEIAQSAGAHDKTPARFWMHNGFINVDNEKMSKSLGNFFTIREVLNVYEPQVVRFFIIRSHYRSPLNYSTVHLDDAKSALRRLYTALAGVEGLPENIGFEAILNIDWTDPHAARFKAAMDEDFSTPEAVAVLFDLAAEINREKNVGKSREKALLLKTLGACLNILQGHAADYLQAGAGKSAFDATAIEAKIQERAQAKAAKNWAEADRIRQELLQAGIVLKDSASGTTWEAAA